MKVGIIGGGQLAKMMAQSRANISEKKIEIIVLDQKYSCAQSEVDQYIVADFDDFAALANFAKKVDIITYEFEHIPINILTYLAKFKPIFPSIEAIRATQDRLIEKQTLVKLGLKTTDFYHFKNEEEFETFLNQLNFKVIIKSRLAGYDGKHQYLINNANEWHKLKTNIDNFKINDYIIEKWLPFDYECSIISLRNQSGLVYNYDIPINTHHLAILRKSIVNKNHPLQVQAETISLKILQHFDYIGVMTIEFFVKNNELIINEIAPRVHNSGHWTIEGSKASQFENHLRALCNLDIKPTTTIGYPALINLISKININLKDLPKHCFLHIYGKSQAKDRKLGHITICGNNFEQTNHLISKINSKINDNE